jgi:hypothetical protein
VSLKPIVLFVSDLVVRSTFDVDVSGQHTILDVRVEEHTGQAHGNIRSKSFNEECLQFTVIIHTGSQDGVRFHSLDVLDNLRTQGVGRMLWWFHRVLADSSSSIRDAPSMAQLKVLR